MTKYHIGPNGVGICKATVSECPYTDYDSSYEANIAYEHYTNGSRGKPILNHLGDFRLPDYTGAQELIHFLRQKKERFAIDATAGSSDFTLKQKYFHTSIGFTAKRVRRNEWAIYDDNNNSTPIKYNLNSESSEEQLRDQLRQRWQEKFDGQNMSNVTPLELKSTGIQNSPKKKAQWAKSMTENLISHINMSEWVIQSDDDSITVSQRIKDYGHTKYLTDTGIKARGNERNGFNAQDLQELLNNKRFNTTLFPEIDISYIEKSPNNNAAWGVRRSDDKWSMVYSVDSHRWAEPLNSPEDAYRKIRDFTKKYYDNPDEAKKASEKGVRFMTSCESVIEDHEYTVQARMESIDSDFENSYLYDANGMPKEFDSELDELEAFREQRRIEKENKSLKKKLFNLLS